MGCQRCGGDWFGEGETCLNGLSFADLDVLVEDVGVHEAYFHSGDCHGSGDGAEIEYALVLEEGEVVERVYGVS